MRQLVLFSRHSAVGLLLVVLLLISRNAQAQGIGFQGGVSIDPEQIFVGTHFETGEIFRNFRFRPGVDGGFGGEFSLATINLEFLYFMEFGGSGWALYQGAGPAVVLRRQQEDTSVHAGTFFTFGFAHQNGFFTDFKLGTGANPILKFGVGFTVRRRTP